LSTAEPCALTVAEPDAFATAEETPAPCPLTVQVPVERAVEENRLAPTAETVASPVADAAALTTLPPLTIASNGARTRSISIPDQWRSVGEGVVSGEGDAPFPRQISLNHIYSRSFQLILRE